MGRRWFEKNTINNMHDHFHCVFVEMARILLFVLTDCRTETMCYVHFCRASVSLVLAKKKWGKGVHRFMSGIIMQDEITNYVAPQIPRVLVKRSLSD